MTTNHYGQAKTGEWSYTDDAVHQTFIFRKGGPADPIVNPLIAQEPGRTPGTEREWLVWASHWGKTNPNLIVELCNLLNREGFR